LAGVKIQRKEEAEASMEHAVPRKRLGADGFVKKLKNKARPFGYGKKKMETSRYQKSSNIKWASDVLMTNRKPRERDVHEEVRKEVPQDGFLRPFPGGQKDLETVDFFGAGVVCRRGGGGGRPPDRYGNRASGFEAGGDGGRR